MDILHLCEGFGGGAARHVIELAHAQAKLGHRVRVIYCPSQLDLQAKALMASTHGITWLVLPMNKAVSLSDVLVLWRISRLIQSGGRPHILHCHCNKGGILGVVLAPFLRVPLVYTPHALYSMQPRLTGFIRACCLAVERAVSRGAQTTILLGRKEAEFARINNFYGCRIRISANGIAPPVGPAPTSLVSSRHAASDRPLVIGFLGRLSYQKGVDTLIAAVMAARDSHFRVEIHGFGPELDHVKKAVDAHPERLSFHGPANGSGVMERFDILVMPSRYEGFPYVLLEALAKGLPLITTDVGGVDEMVADGWNGVIVHGEHTSGLTRILEELQHHDWQTMGRNSFRLSRHYTIAAMNHRIENIYREVLARR